MIWTYLALIPVGIVLVMGVMRGLERLFERRERRWRLRVDTAPVPPVFTEDENEPGDDAHDENKDEDLGNPPVDDNDIEGAAILKYEADLGPHPEYMGAEWWEAGPGTRRSYRDEVRTELHAAGELDLPPDPETAKQCETCREWTDDNIKDHICRTYSDPKPVISGAGS